MRSERGKEQRLIETLPSGFARHQVVLDDQGCPVDYIFLEVNAAFEKMTGLKRENILDRKVTEVLPGIEKDDFDWIGVYGKVAIEGKSLNFEQYSEPLQRWYEVQAYSDEPGFFTTVFNEITARKEELASMKGLLELTEELFNTDLATFDYQSAARNLLKLSGAKFAAINTYEDDRTKTVTRAISGIPSMIESASKLLGFKIAGQTWEIIPGRLRKIEGGKLVRFSSLYETAMGALNKTTSTALHKLTGIGDIYVLELAYGGRETTGDIIFFMPKGKGIHNREVIELYAGQLGAVLGRLRSEEKLLKNEQRLSLAQVNARAGYWEYEIKTERLYWSRECEALFGLEEKEFEGTFDAFLKRVHPEDKEYVLSKNQPITESRKAIPLEYEHRIIKKDETVTWVRETADTVYDNTGEAAFITGFVIDITERKKAEEAISGSELKYRTLTNNLPGVAYRCQYDQNWTMQYMSSDIDSITGHPSAEFIDNRVRSYESVIYHEDKSMVTEEIERAVNAQSPWEIEYRVLHRDGSVRWVQERGRAVLSDQGNVDYLDGLILDITERKQAEIMLQESETHLNQFFSQSLTGFFFMMLDEPVTWDETTDKEKALDYIFHHQRMTKVNQAMLDQYGATEEDFIGKTPYELFKHDLEHGRYIWRGLFEQGRWHVETSERRMDGTPIIIDGDYICLYDSEGRITGHFGVQVDITEQKHQAEQIARLAREQDILLNNIDAQVWYLTDVQTYGAVNEAHAAFFGVDVNDLAHKTLWEIMPSEEEVKICIDGNRQIFSDKESIKTEEYVANGQGKKRLLAITKTPMLDQEGNVKHVVCSAVDITEQKEMERKLKLVLNENETVFQGTQDAIFLVEVIDENTFRFIRNNQAHAQATGLNPEIIKGKTPQELLGEEPGESIAVNYRHCVSTAKTISYEETLDLPSGLRTWHTTLSPVLEQDKVTHIVGSSRDITERKQTETALSMQNTLLKTLQEVSLDGILIVDENDKIISFNQLFADIWEIPDDIMALQSGDKALEFVLPKLVDPEGFANRINDLYKNKQEKSHEEIALVDGRMLERYSAPMFSHDGHYYGRVFYYQDITERKKAEQALEESEARFKSISEMALDAIIMINEQGKIVYWSPSAEKVFGYSNHDAMGKDAHDLLMPEKYRESYMKGFKKFQNTGEGNVVGRVIEVTANHRNGHELPIEIAVSPIHIHGKIWASAIIRDITERKEAEEALSERLAFEKMVSQISTIFINQPPEELDRGLNEALKVAGQFFGADRSYLYAFSENGKTYSVTHTWCAPGIESYYEKDQNRQVKLQSCWAGELLKGNTVIINDVESMPPGQEEDKQDFLSEEIKSLLSIPLAGGGKVFGCFGLDHVNQKHTWAEDQVNLLRVVAELFAGALARHKNEETIRRLSFNDQLTGLYNRRYFENEIKRLDSSREHPVAVISADLDGLKLINDTLGHSEGDRYLQAGAEVLKNALRASDILARVGGDEFALLLPRTSKVESELLMTRIRRQVESYNLSQAGLPLSISLGLAVSEGPDYPLEETFRAADNNMYNDKLQQGKKARTEIVSSLLAALFERGNLSEGQREQVQGLAIQLGTALKLEESRLADLQLLTQVYDLGKVGLPDSILHRYMLNKTEELTEAEREAIHRHPETGYRIASASPELAGVAEMILQHHENFDGSGYPLGLKGEEIPLENRILSIAIAYSAMTNPRPYAETITHEEALEELKRCAGSQFDPQLVEVFTDMMSGQI